MFTSNAKTRSASATPKPLYELFLQLLAIPQIGHPYQTLLDTLYLDHGREPIRSLLVTSAQPGEGKTTVTVSLALTAMLAGRNVLLVDADLRRPSLHHIFGLSNKAGLANLFSGELSVEDAIQILKIPPAGSRGPLQLSVMTSGSADHASTALAINSSQLKETIHAIAPRFDLVFLDSPPVLAVMDALFIAPTADSTLLVLNTGVVTEKDGKQAKQRLEQAGVRLLGVVMNRFDERLHGPGAHPYSKYYSQCR